ncbi:MAG: aa3-type cytochrome c oxidase subunit IV [Alphaproteobacteria bacterium]|nr:MAG: aa3-type cytochrome c oxidase subunit IV [Alphaproteobacteria bacterium]
MMEIQDQERTYEGFIKYMVRGTVAVVVVMALLAMFVA